VRGGGDWLRSLGRVGAWLVGRLVAHSGFVREVW